MRMHQTEQFKRLIVKEIEKKLGEISDSFVGGMDFGDHAAFRFCQGQSTGYLDSIECVNVAYKKLFEEEEDDEEGDN